MFFIQSHKEMKNEILFFSDSNKCIASDAIQLQKRGSNALLTK